MSEQQRYIYPPLTVQGLEALYSNPLIETGYSTVDQQAVKYKIDYDRVVTDIIEIPYKFEDIKLSPNELCTSISIFNIIDKLHYNFIYLNTRSILASNKLPTYYRGYYTCDTVESKLPHFYSNNTPISEAPLPVMKFIGGVEQADPAAPPISGVNNGEDLNELTTGVWIRDNSLIDTTSVSTTGENYHYGFLCSSTSLTVVKMSSNPEHKTVNYDGNGEVSGSKGWAVLDKFNKVQDIPNNRNQLKYNQITKIKTDHNKYIYILDSGVDTPGVGNVSNSSQRSVIYIYDMTGYINPDIDKTIQKHKRVLRHALGDLNTNTNVSDVINPVAFTVDKDSNIIIYDEEDYTFKIYDSEINYLNKYPKRSNFFVGPPGSKKKYLGVSDMVYDAKTESIYVLTPTGYLFTFDMNFKLIDRVIIPRETSNQSSELTTLDLSQKYFKNSYPGSAKEEQFRQIELSQNETNVLYILTSNRVIKKFKTRLADTVGVYDLLKNDIGLLTQPGTLVSYRADLKFFSIFKEANVVLKKLVNSDNETVDVVDTDRTYIYDQMYLYTDFIDIKNSNINKVNLNTNYILSFQEKVNTRSNMLVDDYLIYDISSITSITHKEYNSDIVYNKLSYKLITNHFKMLEQLSYILTAQYSPTGQLIYSDRRYINETMYRKLMYGLSQDYFVGINEYISTSVVNRVIKKVVDIQQQIADTIAIVPTNKWPSSLSTAPVEPFLHTPGGEYLDVNGDNYVGYYYIQEQPSGDVYISGRDSADGDIDHETGNPSLDRYIFTISTE